MLNVGILYFSTARHTSCGSNFGVITVVRAVDQTVEVPHCAAPCMSGAITTLNPTSAGASAAIFANSHSSSDPHAGVEVDEPAEHAEHVFLTPHHTLGHAGGAAGVEDVDVVVGAFAEVTLGRPDRERVLVVDRADRGVSAPEPSSIAMRCRNIGSESRTAAMRGAYSASCTSATRSALSKR